MAPISVAPAPQGRAFTPLDRPIRWGIMGTGQIAGHWAEALTQLPDECRLVAVGSRQRASADEFAARFSVAKAHDSYEALAADPDVDVVYVASPHSHHLAMALLAIANGKHVLVEKPLTVSQSQTLELLRAAADAGVFAMEAMWTRCHPLIRRAQSLLAEGVLGSPRMITATFAGQFEGADSHRMLSPALAGGAILDLGVYTAHTAAALLGLPTSLTAAGTVTHTGVDATSLALPVWQLDDGGVCRGVLITSLEANAECRLELSGTAGSLVIDHFYQPERMQLRPHRGEPQEFVVNDAGYRWQAQEVHRCLQAGEPESPRVPWQSSLDVAAMLDAWLSAVSGNSTEEVMS